MTGIFGGGQTPYYQKVMGFIDGSNLLIQLSKELKIVFRADKPPLSSLSIASLLINPLFTADGRKTIRKYWFASYQGNEEDQMTYARELRKLTFEPILFKKIEGKEKGVDIALATKMLVNAFNQNYDIGVLVAGDKDYVGLVEEVKRYGQIIHGAFFEHGLSEDLSIAVDEFTDIIKKYNVDFEAHPFAEYVQKIKNEIKINKV